MPDIFHTFPVKATAAEAFSGVTSPAGLDAWWTKKASGNPEPGSTYQLFLPLATTGGQRLPNQYRGMSLSWNSQRRVPTGWEQKLALS
jgi:hypothetical protein